MIPEYQGKIVSFYSYSGGIGRSAALAAVAWIMARNGLRVLVVDWDLDSPALDHHFGSSAAESDGVVGFVSAFLNAAPRDSGRRNFPATQAKKFSELCLTVEAEFPGNGGIDFVPAGRRDATYAPMLAALDWKRFYDQQGEALLVSLRELVASRYDYVLIDSRTGAADGERRAMVVPADIVIVGFPLTSAGIDSVATTIGQVESRRGERRVRFLPVPMAVDITESESLDGIRSRLRSVLEPLLTMPAADLYYYWKDVEIPFQRPAVFNGYLDDVREGVRPPGPLTTAYEHLAAVITGRVPGERFGSVVADISVDFASADRYLSEWVAAELEEAGMRVRRRSVDTPSETDPDADSEGAQRVILLSEALLRVMPDGLVPSSSGKAAVLAGRVLVVTLDGAQPVPSLSGADVIRFEAVDEEQAAEALRRALGLSQRVGAVGGGGGQRRPRFPGVKPSVWSLPPRNQTFAGPSSMVDLIRQRLSGDGRPLVLSGLSGLAKSQLALEYAHRFESDYDLVWWIAAGNAAVVRAQLFDLAQRIGVPRGRSDSVEPLLAALGHGGPFERWLLVYDGVEASSDLAGLVPDGLGHVIVTTRETQWEPPFLVTPIDVLTHDQAIAYVKGLLRVSGGDADLLAKRLGDMPSVLDIACAYLRGTEASVSDYLKLLAERLPSTSRRNAGTRVASAPVLVSLDRLRELRPAAARALELCAFLGPEPIPLSVLSNDMTVSNLASFDTLPASRWFVGLLTHQIEELDLARVDYASGTLQVNRMVQAVIQGSLTENESEVTRGLAYTALAAADRGDAEQSDGSLYQMLLPHAVRSEALSSEQQSVREMVVDVVRFRYKRGDFEGSANLARQAYESWSRSSGVDEALCLEVQYHRAHALRRMGRFEQARNLDEDTLARLSAQPLEHTDGVLTAMVEGGLASDLRALGAYKRALELDEKATRWSTDALGVRHPHTLMRASNLAYSLRMVGDLERAKQVDYDTFTRRRDTLTIRHPHTAFSASAYGRDLRDWGEFEESKHFLELAFATYRDVLGSDHPDTLRAAKSLAVTLRRLYQFDEAHDVIVDTWHAYNRRLGTRHPDTILCRLTMATTYAGKGDYGTASRIGQAVVEGFEQVLGGDHVYTEMARSNLAAFELKLGRTPDVVDNVKGIYERLRELLGESHPVVLIVALNLANHQASSNKNTGVTDARWLDEDAYTRLAAQLPKDHPDVLAAVRNFAISMRACGEAEANPLMQQMLVAAKARFGEKHPRVQAAERWERWTNTYVDPPPL